MDENNPQATRKIRITRSEAYAMRIASPRKKGLTFTLIGLLLAVVLGSGLWLFQDAWLPYWLSAPAPAEEADAPPRAAPPPAASALTAPELVDPPALFEEPLDYLSAAVWDHPGFLQGVRTFNQSLDRYRLYLRERPAFTLLEQAEDGAARAAQLFNGLRGEAPAAVPLERYIAQCRRLVEEVRQAGQALPTAVVHAVPPAAPRALSPEELRRHPEYMAGARLFNQALEKFKLYQADTSRKELLQPTEELARQSAQKFEELKRQVPEAHHREIDRQIHQCYGIVSACRGEQLKSGKDAPETPFDRGTAGPARRPALPAYQPPAP
jgi:hypothetical protein